MVAFSSISCSRSSSIEGGADETRESCDEETAMGVDRERHWQLCGACYACSAAHAAFQGAHRGARLKMS